VLLDVLADFLIPAGTRPGKPGVWVGTRAIAHVGVAVCDWVTYYGAALNVVLDRRRRGLPLVADPLGANDARMTDS